jgi:16S rRNA (cytidine1402-2'-O)-methyltransferase
MEDTAHGGQAARDGGTLYVVATPIGNLADITLRALEVLKRVAVVAAEDTRVTMRLLRHYEISVPLIALHAHNERDSADKLLGALASGRSVALVSDAGTPAISDPGAVAVAAVRAAGYPVVPIPGANAATCALSAAGIQAPHYLFYGFLPQKPAARRTELEKLQAHHDLIIFYEAPHRVLASISDIAEVFGSARTITIARELTKLFEVIHACPLGAAASWFAADQNRVKGEFVLLVEGAAKDIDDHSDQHKRVLEILLRETPLKQAVKVASEITGAKRNELYALALSLKKA